MLIAMVEPVSNAPVTDSGPRRRRRWQFSLRTILLAMLIGAMPLAWLGHIVRRDRERRAALEKLADAQVTFSALPSWIATSTWIRDLPLAEHVNPVGHVGLNYAKDDDLAALRPFRELRWLELHGEGITDQGFATLQGMSELQLLILAKTRIGGPGLRHLQAFPRLQTLYITEMPLGASEVADFPPLPNLLGLTLGVSQLEAESLATLLQKTPNLEFLALGGRPLGDDDFAAIARLSRLGALSLNRMQITGRGLSRFQDHPSLRALDLEGSDLDTEALESLQRLDNLGHLTLDKTPVSDDQLEELRQALPNTRISANQRRVNGK